jgi:hypothetical protein
VLPSVSILSAGDCDTVAVAAAAKSADVSVCAIGGVEPFFITKLGG